MPISPYLTHTFRIFPSYLLFEHLKNMPRNIPVPWFRSLRKAMWLSKSFDDGFQSLAQQGAILGFSPFSPHTNFPLFLYMAVFELLLNRRLTWSTWAIFITLGIEVPMTLKTSSSAPQPRSKTSTRTRMTKSPKILWLRNGITNCSNPPVASYEAKRAPHSA